MPLPVRLILGALLALIGLALLVIALLGARDRLPRNRFAGVRTAASMRSDAAFRLAQRVAAAPLGAAGAIAVTGGITVAAGSGSVPAVVLGVAVAGTLILGGLGGMLGDRAAARLAAAAAPTACAGVCAGCDLVAGCRDSVPDYQPQEPGPPLNGPTTSGVTQPP